MHLVDDIHAHFDRAGRVNCVVTQNADGIDAVVRGRVDLQHVHAAALVDGAARRAQPAGVAMIRVFTVDGLGQNLGAGRLAGAARTGKQIRMAELARFKLCAQCVSHALLTDYIRKCLRPVFAV